jgi:hypothetical protein
LLGSVVEHADGVVAIRGHGHTGTVHSLQARVEYCHEEVLRLLVLSDRAICVRGVESETPLPVCRFR